MINRCCLRLRTLPPGDGQIEAVQAVGEAMAERDLETALTWLKTLPDGAPKRNALEQMVAHRRANWPMAPILASSMTGIGGGQQHSF